MHGSFNLGYFNAATYAQLISKKESRTQDWHKDYASNDPNAWDEYYKKSEKLGMIVIYSLEGR
jgi:hypothetical protein